MSEKVKGYIKKLFIMMNEEVDNIIDASISYNNAICNIKEYVLSNVITSSKGYVIDLYSELSKQTLSEEVFQNPVYANKFYELNIAREIRNSDQLKIESLKGFSKEIDFKEINRIYAGCGATIGTIALGGLLGKATGIGLAGMGLIGLVGIAAGALVYSKTIPEKNKVNFQQAVRAFMKELEEDLLNWVDRVIGFYNQKIAELKATL